MRRPLLPPTVGCGPEALGHLGGQESLARTPSWSLCFNKAPGVVRLSTKVPDAQLWMTTLEMPWRLSVSADTHPPSAGLGRGPLPPPISNILGTEVTG